MSATAAVLLLLTPLGTWAPLAHWSCESNGQVLGTNDTWIPAVLVNSPYQGNSTGTGIMDWSFPGAWNAAAPPAGDNVKVGWGTMQSNGTSGAALSEVNLSFERLQTTLVLGPGANSRCSSSFAVVYENPWQYGGTSQTIATTTNFSDVGEATNVTLHGFGLQSPNLMLSFENGFDQANEPQVSTCGSVGLTLPVVAYGVGVTFNVSTPSASFLIHSTLPFVESFSYSFPANTGTWQVDNLSAPGGPGGGWAFSYVGPCP